MTPNLPPWWFWIFWTIHFICFISLEMNRIPKSGIPILSGGKKIGEINL